jgi:hypothetical protein
VTLLSPVLVPIEAGVDDGDAILVSQLVVEHGRRK